MEMFFILTEAMYESLGQAIVIYLVSRLVLLSFPQLTAAGRYNMLLLAQSLVFLLFCLNIFEGVRDWDRYSTSAAFALQDSEPVSARFFSIRMLIMSKADLIGRTYFIGLALHFLLYVYGLIRVRSLSRGEAITSGEWSRKLESWSARLNIRRRVGLVTGEKTGVPFTAGFLKPVIYFPVTAFNNLTSEQAEAILLHELAHIRRNDYLVNLIQKAMEMVLFFNPVCWSLGAEIRREREFCCDDLVIAHTSDPRAYAHGLFILEQQLALAGPALSATGQKSDTLLERIKRITHMNNQRITLKPGVYALLGFLAAGLSLAWITPATEADLQKDAGKDRVSASIKRGVSNDLRTVFVDTVPGPDTNEIKKYFSSPEWKKNEAEIKAQSEKLRKQFESPEWKKHMADIQKNSEELKKHFESPEWKKHQEMLAQHGEKMKKYFESPEWKKQVQD
ncbi:MAG TPA: M56 family metallopeptidase, partial [Sphingobacteriaceae bacterium]